MVNLILFWPLYALYLLILVGVINWEMVFGWWERRHRLSLPHLLIEGTLSLLAFVVILCWVRLPLYHFLGW